MKTIQTKLRSGSDGVLTIRVPSGMADTELDVIVILEPAGTNGPRAIVDADEWRRFIEETAGSIPDPTFQRPAQGEYEPRGNWG